MKTKSRERIDGIVAMIMALERATTDERINGPFFDWNPADGILL